MSLEQREELAKTIYGMSPPAREYALVASGFEVALDGLENGAQ
jgi:hypothetical protein